MKGLTYLFVRLCSFHADTIEVVHCSATDWGDSTILKPRLGRWSFNDMGGSFYVWTKPSETHKRPHPQPTFLSQFAILHRRRQGRCSSQERVCFRIPGFASFPSCHFLVHRFVPKSRAKVINLSAATAPSRHGGRDRARVDAIFRKIDSNSLASDSFVYNFSSGMRVDGVNLIRFYWRKRWWY